MGECVEAVFAVVRPGAGTAHAAKGGVRDAGVHDGVVDRHAAGLGIGENWSRGDFVSKQIIFDFRMN